MSAGKRPVMDAQVMSEGRRWAALGVLVAAVLLLAIDGTVLYLAVPSLTRDLAPTATQILWIGDIYSLALAGLLVTMGTLADRVGRKRLLLIGTTAFGLASLLAAFSTSAELLIAARLLLGVAGATIMPSTLSIIRNMFADPRQRTRAIAVWSAAGGGGIALGPLVGGALLERFWWGSVFLINVPIMVALLVTGIILLPESRDPNPGRFDLLSAGLSMATIVPLVYAVKHAVSDGLDAITLGCLLAGLVLGVLFVRRQRHLTAPLIDVGLFRNPAFSGAVLANFIAIFALTGLLFFFSQYLQLARGFSPLRAGLAEMPATIASILVVGLVGVAITRLGRGRAIAAGLGLTAVGLLLVAAAEGAEHYLWLGLALVPVGLGVGLAMTLTTDVVVSAVPPRKAGAASAISETAYELGVALGIAILGSVVTLAYRAFVAIPEELPGTVQDRIRDSLASALSVVEPGSDLAHAAREAFVHAMQITSVAAAILAAIAAIAAWRTIPSTRD
ncbi:Antiseptic resistance protein [Micromonospora sp. MW-13]|uniref:MFS transporter n=1 Tax=unclassified Micromonospora TaxID=2617518 RepID=UPI000EC9ABA3|nr:MULTISPECIES: MFS transporter [unclassified Micromonospora]MCX4472492.1 MFS transporter [Micromonospora sp. NBC_01655]RGC69180.1 Antiseptic resistance protein [Micromonospora sp. MW-13]